VHRDVAVRLKGLPVEAPSAPTTEPDDRRAFKIRLAGSQETHRAARLLVRQRYAKRGYRALATPANPNVWTFAAYDEGQLAGTITVRLDSADGVAADTLYRSESMRFAATATASASSGSSPSTRRGTRSRCSRGFSTRCISSPGACATSTMS
jgi:hypothetical protein